MSDEIKFNSEAFENYKKRISELRKKTQNEPEIYATEESSFVENNSNDIVDELEDVIFGQQREDKHAKVDIEFEDIKPTDEVAQKPVKEVPKPKQHEKITATLVEGGGSSFGQDRIILKPLNNVMHDSMMPYTEHVIMDRALPRVEDGLKPVQRRILYTMMELGLESDKPFRKSARIVGDCLGKYHPHGDISVYDAMVRLAQDFNMRSILVQGHGNFGSVDGDSAAAMRYTEARLAPLAMEMLRGLDQNTVKFVLNFDDTLKEPETLPGRFPNLLVNGSSGIAVSLATNIPPHNLGEVIDGTIAYIENPQISLAQMLKIIKGPDFPTGAFLIAGDELYKAYETGRGKVTMRAKLFVEQNGDKQNIVITEFPFQTNKARLLLSIAETIEEKKTPIYSYISDIVDESDRNGTRAVIKLKKDAPARQIIENLFKDTGLQATFGINMIAIADNKPQQMGLLDIISYYVNYQRQIIIKRSEFQLDEAQAREHIVLGLIVAIENIDEVVRIIKKSANTSDAKQKLMLAFKLTEKQAQSILDMRLARLTSLEIEKLQNELKELKEKINKLQQILSSRAKQFGVIKTELLEIKKKYADARRTTILNSFSDYDLPEDCGAVDLLAMGEECVVVVNEAGLVKRVPIKNFNLSSKEYAEQTNLSDFNYITFKTNTMAEVLAFTNYGNCLKLQVRLLQEAKWKDKGSVLSGLKQGEKIVKIIDGNLNDDVKLAFFTQDGIVKVSLGSEFVVQKSCFQAIKLKDGDYVVNVCEVLPDQNMIFITKQKMILHADLTDVPLRGRVAQGVKGINLNDNDACVYADLCNKADEIIVASNDGYAKKFKANDIEKLARYRKGVQIAIGDKLGEIVFASKVENFNLIAKTTKEYFRYIPLSEISKESRQSKGKAFLKLTSNEKISNLYIFR